MPGPLDDSRPVRSVKPACAVGAPNPGIRNGAEGVELAERANVITGGTQSFVLDTLGMAYAEAGHVSDAIKAQEQAIDRAKAADDKDALPALQQRLELYRSGKAYLEPIAPGVGAIR